MESSLSGQAVWTCRELEDVKTAKVFELLSEGNSVRDVAEELGISKSQAGRLRRTWVGQSVELSHRPSASEWDNGTHESSQH